MKLGCQNGRLPLRLSQMHFILTTVPRLVTGRVRLAMAASLVAVFFPSMGTVTAAAPRLTAQNSLGFASYVSVTPARVADTRANSGSPYAGRSLGAGQTLTVQVTGGVSGVPASAVAVVLNVTAVAPSAAGFLTVFPAATVRPGVSSLNFAAGQTVPNQVTVAVSPSGAVAIFNSAGVTNVVVDVDGYYTSISASTTSGLYNPISPARVMGTSQGGAQVPADAGLAVTVAGGSTGVPESATAVVINATAAAATSASFLTIYPTGVARPLASNLNFGPQLQGQATANRVTVGIGAGGQITVYNHAGTVAVDVDLDGYYSGSGGTGAAFVAIQPVRLTDTRVPLNGTSIPATSTERFQFLKSSVPASATAVAANFTVIPGSAPGYLTVYPGSTSTQPVASDLNWTANQSPAVANSTIADTANSGSVRVFNGSRAPVNLVIDAFGYFTSVPAVAPVAPPFTLTAAPPTVSVEAGLPADWTLTAVPAVSGTYVLTAVSGEQRSPSGTAATNPAMVTFTNGTAPVPVTLTKATALCTSSPDPCQTLEFTVGSVTSTGDSPVRVLPGTPVSAAVAYATQGSYTNIAVSTPTAGAQTVSGFTGELQATATPATLAIKTKDAYGNLEDPATQGTIGFVFASGSDHSASSLLPASPLTIPANSNGFVNLTYMPGSASAPGTYSDTLTLGQAPTQLTVTLEFTVGMTATSPTGPVVAGTFATWTLTDSAIPNGTYSVSISGADASPNGDAAGGPDYVTFSGGTGNVVLALVDAQPQALTFAISGGELSSSPQATAPSVTPVPAPLVSAYVLTTSSGLGVPSPIVTYSTGSVPPPGSQTFTGESASTTYTLTLQAIDPFGNLSDGSGTILASFTPGTNSGGTADGSTATWSGTALGTTTSQITISGGTATVSLVTSSSGPAAGSGDLLQFSATGGGGSVISSYLVG